MFCPYCGAPFRTDFLEGHCLDVHNENPSALFPNEEVKMPEYENCESFIENYPDEEAIPKANAKMWRNPGISLKRDDTL